MQNANIHAGNTSYNKTYCGYVFNFINSNVQYKILFKSAIQFLGGKQRFHIVANRFSKNGCLCEEENWHVPDDVINFSILHIESIKSYLTIKANNVKKGLCEYISGLIHFSSIGYELEDVKNCILYTDTASFDHISTFREVLTLYVLQEICRDYAQYSADNNINLVEVESIPLWPSITFS